MSDVMRRAFVPAPPYYPVRAALAGSSAQLAGYRSEKKGHSRAESSAEGGKEAGEGWLAALVATGS
jgi:hypothetical protein